MQASTIEKSGLQVKLTKSASKSYCCADQPWVTVAENVAVLTVVLEGVEVTEATEATEVAAEAVDGAEAERTRKRSGCPAPSWAVWSSRYNSHHSPNVQMSGHQKLQAFSSITDYLSNYSRVCLSPQIAATTVRWTSRARLSGGLVLQGKIKSLEQIYLFSMPVKEYQIVESFLGSALKDEVMKIMPVQKQTRAGQRTRFKAFVVVGDHNGHVGLGVKCAKEVSASAAICTPCCIMCISVSCLAYPTALGRAVNRAWLAL